MIALQQDNRKSEHYTPSMDDWLREIEMTLSTFSRGRSLRSKMGYVPYSIIAVQHLVVIVWHWAINYMLILLFSKIPKWIIINLGESQKDLVLQKDSPYDGPPKRGSKLQSLAWYSGRAVRSDAVAPKLYQP